MSNGRGSWRDYVKTRPLGGTKILLYTGPTDWLMSRRFVFFLRTILFFFLEAKVSLGKPLCYKPIGNQSDTRDLFSCILHIICTRVVIAFFFSFSMGTLSKLHPHCLVYSERSVNVKWKGLRLFSAAFLRAEINDRYLSQHRSSRMLTTAVMSPCNEVWDCFRSGQSWTR